MSHVRSLPFFAGFRHGWCPLSPTLTKVNRPLKRTGLTYRWLFQRDLILRGVLLPPPLPCDGVVPWLFFVVLKCVFFSSSMSDYCWLVTSVRLVTSDWLPLFDNLSDYLCLITSVGLSLMIPVWLPLFEHRAHRDWQAWLPDGGRSIAQRRQTNVGVVG